MEESNIKLTHPYDTRKVVWWLYYTGENLYCCSYKNLNDTRGIAVIR